MNPNEPTVYTQTIGGLDLASDITDLPLGVWREAENTMTFAREKYQRTRDGYLPASTRLFDKPVPLIGGPTTGNPVDPPWVDDDDDTVDSGTALKLVANPAEGDAPLNVTFTTYGTTELGIATLDWDFSVEGGRVSEESGAATSTTNNYTSEGTYTCAVWGTGSDGQVYIATRQVQVNDGGVVVDDPPTATLRVNGKTADFTMEPGVASITWTTSDADSAYLNGEEVGLSGSRSVTLDEGVYGYVLSAYNDAGQVDSKTIYVTVEGDIDEELPPTVNLNASPLEINNGDTVAFSIASERADTLSLYIGDAPAVDVTGSSNHSSAVSRPGAAPVGEDYLVTCTAVALNAYGTARSDLVVKVLADGSSEDVAFLAITVPTQTKTATDFEVEVTALASDGVTPASVPVGQDIILLQNADTSGITNNLGSVVPTWDVDRQTATFNGCQLTLPVGESLGTTDLFAEIPTQGVNSPLASIQVYDEDVYFDVDTVDATGADLTQLDADYSTGYWEATFYITVVPREDVGDAVVTDYDGDAEPAFSVPDGWPTDPEVSYLGVTAGTTYDEVGNQPLVGGTVIPSAVFVQGNGYVIVKVLARWLYSPQMPQYLDLKFSAEKHNE